MGQIFDREFRREKNLLTQKKLNKEATGKDKKGKDASKLQAERESGMKDRIVKIEEEFFTSVSKDEDLAAIKARGDLNQEEAGKE